MLTQCPSCHTTFRVTSEILRVADGQVRCGRCQTQFDALERLIEESDAGEIQSGRYLRPPEHLPSPASTQIEVEEPVTHEDITMEGRHIEISGTYEIVDEHDRSRRELREQVVEEWVEFDALSEELTDGEITDEPSEEFREYSGEEFVQSGEEHDWTSDIPDASGELLADDEFLAQESSRELMEDDEEASDRGPRRGPSDEPTDVSGYEVIEGSSGQLANDSGDEGNEGSSGEPWQEPGEALAVQRAHEDEELELLARQPAGRRSWLWRALAAPLALLLIVQIVHEHRGTLARHPRLGPPLMDLYAALGLDLHPRWNLHAYEVRQWGIVSDPMSPGTLKVRASIKNLAGFAQPYPLLKLVLEDRWGEQVRVRAFTPSEYLDPATAPNRLLAPAQQTNATIAIVDPGPDAEGFRFDICLQGRAGPVCAADVPSE